MTILFAVFYSLDAIATAFVSVMIDAEWSQLSSTQKWIRVALITKAWATAMLAFFTNSAKKLKQEQLPFDDTQQFQKQDKQEQLPFDDTQQFQKQDKPPGSP